MLDLLLGQGAAGLIGGIGGKLGDMLGMGTSISDIVSQQSDYFNKMQPQILAANLEAAKKGQTNAMGQFGDQVTQSAKTQADRYTNTMDAKTADAVAGLKSGANDLLGNIGQTNALAQKSAAQSAGKTSRDLTNAAMRSGNPGSVLAIADKLGEANQAGANNLASTMGQQANQAISGAASMNAQAGQLGESGMQSQYARNVEPYLAKQSQIDSGAAQAMNMSQVAGRDVLQQNPLSGIADAISGQMTAGQINRNSLAGKKDWKDSWFSGLFGFGDENQGTDANNLNESSSISGAGLGSQKVSRGGK